MSKITCTLIGVLLFVFSPHLLQSQSALHLRGWRTAGPYGETVNVFAIDGEARIFAGTQSGVYFSEDHGGTWAAKNNGLPPHTHVQALAIQGAARIFAGTRGGFRDLERVPGKIYVSENLGEDWDEISAGLPNDLEMVGAFAITDSGHVFAGASDGVYFWDSNENRWVSKNNGFLRPTGVGAFIAAGPNRLMAGTSDGVFVSTDNGENWRQKNLASELPIVEPRISSLAADGNGGIFAGLLRDCDIVIPYGYIYHTTDFGENWRNVSDGLLEYDSVNRLAANNNGEVFAAMYESGVYRWNETEQKWLPTNSGLPDFVKAWALAFDDLGNAYLGAQRGIFRSTNNGESWSLNNTGLTGVTVRDLAVDEYDRVFAAAGIMGLHRSTDNAHSWNTLSPSDLDYLNVGSLGVGEDGTIFIGGTTLFSCSRPLGNVFRSTDNGLTWTTPGQQYLPESWLFAETPPIVKINKNGYVFAGLRHYRKSDLTITQELYRSRNNGESWQKLNLDLEFPQFEVISSMAFSDGDVFFGTNHWLYRSTDEGAQWTRLTDLGRGEITALAIHQGVHIYIARKDTIFWSADSGESWMLFNNGLSGRKIHCLAIQEGGEILAGTDEGIFLAHHAIDDWEKINSGLMDCPVLSLAIDAEGYAFAGTHLGVFSSNLPVVHVESDDFAAREKAFNMQVYPNPFNPAVTIEFSLVEAGFVTLNVYDALGREVARLVEQPVLSGSHRIVWNPPKNLPSGVYISRLTSGQFSRRSKMLLLR